MGWNNILEQILDSPTYLLIGIVLLAIILALILALFERKMKKDPKMKSRIGLTLPEDPRIKRIRMINHTNKTPKEKLDSISEIVKEVIKEYLASAQREEYPLLIDELKKIKELELAELSEEMMHVYYFPEKIDNEKLNELSSELIRIIRNKDMAKLRKQLENQGFFRKILNSFKSEFSHRKEKIRKRKLEKSIKAHHKIKTVHHNTKMTHHKAKIVHHNAKTIHHKAKTIRTSRIIKNHRKIKIKHSGRKH